MNKFLFRKILDIKSKGGTWENLIFDENDDLDIGIFDLLLKQLNLPRESEESLIDQKIEEFFNSFLGDEND